MKKYLFLSFKKKIPLFVIIAVTFLVIAFVSSSTIDFVARINKEGYYFYRDRDTGFIGLMIALFITTTFLPFFNMNYRYSLSRSDTFRQAAFKERHIRYGEHLVTLITALLAFTLAFIVLVVGLRINNATTYLPPEDTYFKYELITFEYVWYIPLYFAAVILSVLEYFVCYFFISRSNNFLNSLITLVMGQGFLTCIINIPSIFFTTVYLVFNHTGSTASIFFPISYLYAQFNPLIYCGENDIADLFTFSSKDVTIGAIQFIAASTLFLGLSGLGIYAFLKEKDPSSEWANKPGSNKIHQEIIFHAGFFAMGALIACGLAQGSSIVWLILFYSLFGATYYTMYGLLNRNFKLKLRETFTLVGVVLAILAVSIAYAVVVSINTPQYTL